MHSSRNELVAARFAARVRDYERHAGLQAEIADALADMLPDAAQPSVLEVGCGTGLLTRHLLDRYPDGSFLITDLAEEMVAECARNHRRPNGRAVRFAVMDGEEPETPERFDIVVLSMTAQWFSDPAVGLERLKGLLHPEGTLLYATIAPGSFPEWRAALDAYGLRHGYVEMPALPGTVREEVRVVEYESGVAFLRALAAIGAATPRAGYAPLPAGSLRAALRRLEDEHGARITWRIVYGVISA